MPNPHSILSSPTLLARHIIDYGALEEDQPLEALGIPRERAALEKVILGLPFPAGLAPTPQPITPPPSPSAPLPEADYLVVTWTVAEVEALADTLTPGVRRDHWNNYDRNYDSQYRPNIRKGAPSQRVGRLGSWFLTRIGTKKVLCFKSELHLNQDGMRTGDGTATLPVKDMFHQLISEVKPRMVLTVGTAGATFPDHELGDVIITRAAKFRLSQEFRNEDFNGKTYRCDFTIPTRFFNDAQQLMARHADQLREPDFGPPTKRYAFTGPLIHPPRNTPDIKMDGRDMPEFHPMLTTDFFEFGTSRNGLETAGAGVEMGDAVLGLVAEELGAKAPLWLVIRNASDPQINGDLPDAPRALNMQAHWAVWYYESFGYWTSVNSALGTWAVIAGHGSTV
ncbi:hypothetical protein JY651_18585 [Pyxidicoccus parkwayensis]|uniref:Nucleoside phosphorylase domain-containing protein n=1 Tax=Pyxidicoccus parkwayensis TaxID=2813578 RepID=A0ABX7P8L9_9BACT|nr:hypothetical protein [Pyxidicoccus parkwaysis]QSQ26797.1 hypothetical protein JY651_18585 [Pyxidicoccus parkwaysis]